MNKTISTIEKNATEEIRIELTDFKGHDLIGIRVYTDVDNNTDKVPTRKGITCNVKLIPDLVKALSDAEDTARKEGLLE